MHGGVRARMITANASASDSSSRLDYVRVISTPIIIIIIMNSYEWQRDVNFNTGTLGEKFSIAADYEMPTLKLGYA